MVIVDDYNGENTFSPKNRNKPFGEYLDSYDEYIDSLDISLP